MEKTDLQKRYTDAVAVKEMMATEGWKIVERELDTLYSESLTKLIEAEDVQARANIKVVSQLRNRLIAIVSKGKLALEQLNKNQEG